MAFSETVSNTVFNTGRVITTAFRRCKLPAQTITSEHTQIAQDALYLLLSALANKGVQLWCVDKVIMPFYEGVAAMTLPLGVVDVLNANFRTLSEVTGTNTDTSTSRTIEFDSATAVTTVGINWSSQSPPIIFERSDDGVTWTTIQTETPSAVTDEWSWFDMFSIVAATYFRIRATSGTLGFNTIYTGNNPTEIPAARINRDQYANLSNKAFLSNSPPQFWYDRQVNYPVMRLWPTPNAAMETRQMVVWLTRYIMDVGTLTQDLNIPQRWYMAVVCELARQLAREIPEVDVALVAQLDADAAAEMAAAMAEERDNSPQMFAPNISMYTA